MLDKSSNVLYSTLRRRILSRNSRNQKALYSSTLGAGSKLVALETSSNGMESAARLSTPSTSKEAPMSEMS